MTDLPELPTPQRRAVDIVRDVALENDIHPYLVGGPVRDLLLGRNAFDIDLTVPEDSSTLARALAKRLNGRVKSFPQFLTYKVVAAEMPEIDIATARKERYRSPGALPTVTAGKLKDDLARRDFSINAIALDIVDGAIHDPTGGVRDLEAKLVRVLHPRSFIDDPTRAFRAVRLACRLGFSIEESTATLLQEAVSGGALATVSRERLWRELFLAVDEFEAPAVLRDLLAWGLLEVLFGKRTPHDQQLEIARRCSESDAGLDRYVLYTAALLHGDASPIDLEGSGFSQKRARNVMQVANELGRFRDAIAEAKSERQRLRLLRHATDEMLAVLAETHPSTVEPVARYRSFRTFQLPLRGNELEVPPGPHVARALERTREAVFSGEIPAEDARAFARQIAIQYLDRE